MALTYTFSALPMTVTSFPGASEVGSSDTTETVPKPEPIAVWYVPVHEAALVTVFADLPRPVVTVVEGSQSEALDDSMSARFAAVAAFCGSPTSRCWHRPRAGAAGS